MKYFNLIYPLLFILIGVPGNLISMVVWLKRIRSSPGSTCLYLTVMCATDTYVLVHGCARNWLKSLDRYVLTTVANASSPPVDPRVVLGCGPPLFVFTFLSDFSVWLIVFLSFERFVCARYPLRVQELCRLRNGCLFLLAALVLLAGVNSLLFLMVAVGVRNQRITCVERHLLPQSFRSFWPYLDFGIYSLVPLITIVTFHQQILIRLHQGHPKNSSSRSKRAARILKTIVTMAITHFLFTMPIGIYFLIDRYICTLETMYRCDILNEVFVMLQLANHLTHFFIYSRTSSLFMVDLMALIPMLRCLTRQQRHFLGLNRPRTSQLVAEFQHVERTHACIELSEMTSFIHKRMSSVRL